MTDSLFCLANASISGGNKAILECARGLAQRGQVADIYIWHPNQNLNWFDDKLTVLTSDDIETAVNRGYDMVFFAKAFLIPLAFAHLGSAEPVFICHDFESAYVATTFDAINLECPPFDDVLRLPIDVITTSKPVQKIMRERLNKEAYFIPLAIDKSMFEPQTTPRVQRERKRVLMVGDHLLPTKGIRDGLKALKILAGELPVELVLITREERGQQIFEGLGYPCEIHVRPDPAEVQDIYASCDVYCCTSWYEGFGLPALEAFRVGIPVVSTRNSGVSNYGFDEDNLLLCQPHDPEDLSQKLKRILLDENLRAKLIEQGRKTEDQFDWERTIDEFVSSQQKILSSPALEVSVSNDRIQQLLRNLEDNGLYTPHSVHQSCSDLFKRIDLLLEDLSENRVNVVTGLAELGKLRDNLKKYLAKPGAEYYSSCKKRYDLCQLVIGLGDDKQFLEHLSKLVAQLNRSKADNSAEIQPKGVAGRRVPA